MKLIAYVVTETNHFKQWFNGSQAVEQTGKPLVLYHGTGSTFESFELSESGMLGGQGIYLTPDPEYAGNFARGDKGNVIPVYAAIKNPLKIVSPTFQPEVYKKALDLFQTKTSSPQRLRNLSESEALQVLKDSDPATLGLTLLGIDYDTAEGMVDSSWEETESGFISSDIFDLAISKGYDGIFLYSVDTNELVEIVAFDAKQIVSAITGKPMAKKLGN